MSSDQEEADAAPQLADGEVRIRKGWANHWLGDLAEGGSLHLTNLRLTFRAHVFNLEALSGSIDLGDIVRVDTGKRFNELIVHLAGGGSERFVVWHRKAWISDITAACGNAARA